MRSSAVTVLTIVVLGGAACAAPTAAAVPSGPAQPVSTDPWSVGVPLPQPRADAAAEVFGTTLYVAGGTDADHDTTATVYAYSSATRTWRAEAPMPRPRAHFALLHVGSYLYAVGGGLTSVDRYDPAANRWAAGVVSAAPRAIGPATLATGGGLIEAFTTTPDGRAVALTFDPAKNRWRQAPAVTLPGTASTQWSAAAPLGASDVMLLSPERIVDYSPTSNTYTALPYPYLSDSDCDESFNLSEAHRDPNGRIVVLGGYGECDEGGGQGTLSVSAFYDPTLRRWALGAVAPSYAADQALAVSGGALYAIGGDSDDSPVAEVDVLHYRGDRTPPAVTGPAQVVLSDRDASGYRLAATADSVPVRVSAAATDPSTVAGDALRATSSSAPYGGAVVLRPADDLGYYADARTNVAFRAQVSLSDGVGNATAWLSAPVVTPVLVDDSAAVVTYSGAWTLSPRSGAVTHYSSAAGATATFTFTGTSVAWLSECELARGSRRVYVDGRDEGLIGQGCEDSLHGSGPVLRAVQSWPTAGRHTVRVVGTGGGAVVNVAGFAYLH